MKHLARREIKYYPHVVIQEAEPGFCLCVPKKSAASYAGQAGMGSLSPPQTQALTPARKPSMLLEPGFATKAAFCL